MKRRRKRIIIRIVVLAVFFIAAATAAFLFSRQVSVESNTVIDLAEPTLPVVEAQVENTTVNLMHGYVNEMTSRYMRDAVTPLPSDRQLKLKITGDEGEVKELSYEIRSMDTTELIEATDVETLNRTADSDGTEVVTATLPIQNLLDKNQEYMLIIYLKTAEHDKITYYTRIVKTSSYPTGKMLNFVREFHNKTLNYQNNTGMASYLKTNTDTGKNLGHVTLNSSYSMLMWDYLNPVETVEPRIKIMDISSTIGTFLMESQVSFTDSAGESHVCNVTESFTVQYTNKSWYVLDYERTANEVLARSAGRSGKTQLTLGIADEDDLTAAGSENGLCQAFASGGNLWMNQSDENGQASLRRIFSFSENDTPLDTDSGGHRIKIVSVGDDGSCSFLLYGYMNSGDHEGEVGLTFYEYSAETNRLNERFYLPFDRSAELLMQEMGRLSYINDSDLFYMMLDNTIYAIDFTGREYMTIVENVTDDSLAINEDSSVVAWEEERTDSGAGKVVILYLEDGHQNVVTAADGEKLHVLGFVGQDVAVGHIKSADYEKYSSQTQYPMYKMEIVDSAGAIAGTYEKDNIMITSAEEENGSILIHRSQVNGSALAAASDDAMIGTSGEENEEADMITGVKGADGYVIDYLNVYAVPASEEIGKVTQAEISDSSYLKITLNETSNENQFYAWAKGRLQAVCGSVSDAVDLVYNDVGYVTDCNGNYVLRRGYRGYFSLDLSTVARAKDSSESMKTAMQVFSTYEGGSYSESFDSMEAEGLTKAQILQRGVNCTVYDLTGCSMSRIIYYYLGHGHPIYAETDSGAVLITGVSNDNVTIWNPLSGKSETVDLDSAEKSFARAGNVFISCLD